MNQDTLQPVPQGRYLPSIRHHDTIYTSGMTPRENGVLKYAGKIQKNGSFETYHKAVELAAKNALLSAQDTLREDEEISKILQLVLYLNTEDGFDKHSKIADFASNFLVEKLGDKSIGSRVAVGAKTLPSNAMVEISMICIANLKKQ